MENKYKHILEAFGERDKNGKKWEDYDTIVCPDGEIIDMQKLLDDQNRAKAALLRQVWLCERRCVGIGARWSAVVSDEIGVLT